jgi:hypothetical protein
MSLSYIGFRNMMIRPAAAPQCSVLVSINLEGFPLLFSQRKTNECANNDKGSDCQQTNGHCQQNDSLIRERVV